MFRRLSIAAAVVGLWPFAPVSAAGPKTPTLPEQVAALVASYEGSSGAVTGVSAVELATGRTLLALRAGEMFAPASNQKLLTAAFALERLGADFRFVTGVFLAGEDVVVAGDGDPTLGDPILAAAAGRSIYAELDRWAEAVREATGGVRNVLLCCRIGRPARHPHWPADQKHKWYAAPVSLLNYHDNCFDVTFARMDGGLAPVVRPQHRYVRVQSRLKIGSRHRWWPAISDRDTRLLLAGTITGATENPESIAVDYPALLLGRTFLERLARAGVAVGGRIRRVAPREVPWSAARAICRTPTPLFTAIHRASKRSLNLAAEAIFLRAGDGTWPGSAEMMTRTLTKAFGLPPGSVLPADGSGLSHANRVSPAAVTKLLSAVSRRPDALLLLASLPVGGVDGTLSDRFERPPCRGRIIAKTGHISAVSCLSGYVLDEQRRARIAFSILVNRILRGGAQPAKRLQDAICRMLIDWLASRGPVAHLADRHDVSRKFLCQRKAKVSDDGKPRRRTHGRETEARGPDDSPQAPRQKAESLQEVGPGPSGPTEGRGPRPRGPAPGRLEAKRHPRPGRPGPGRSPRVLNQAVFSGEFP